MKHDLTIFCPFSAGDATVFSIDPNDGIIATKTILDRRIQQNYSIEVLVDL